MRSGRQTGLMLAAFLAGVSALAFFRPGAVMRAGLVLAVLFVLGLLFGCQQRARHLHGLLLPLLLFAAGWTLSLEVARELALSGAVQAIAACLCLGLSVLTLASPRTGKRLLELWMDAAHPIGWCVSNGLLAAIYYLVITPAGVLLRLLGRDPLARRFEKEKDSYWLERESRRALESYFRQF